MKSKSSRNGEKKRYLAGRARRVNIFGLEPFEGLSRDFVANYFKQAVASIRSTLLLLHADSKVKLVRSAKLLLTSEASVDERVRIASCKLLVAALPESEKIVEGLLTNFSNALLYEVHFTMFCFLDEIPYLMPDHRFNNEMPTIISRYLMSVRTNKGMAAWMAADLLSDHWPVDATLSKFMDVVKHGKHAPGREAAIHGISNCLRKLDEEVRNDIIGRLQVIVSKEKERAVKAAFRFLISSFGLSTGIK